MGPALVVVYHLDLHQIVWIQSNIEMLEALIQFPLLHICEIPSENPKHTWGSLHLRPSFPLYCHPYVIWDGLVSGQ